MSKRRKLIWARTQASTALGAGAVGSWIDLLAAFRTQMGITANLPGTTVSRIHLDCFAVATAASSGLPLTIGIRKCTLREMVELTGDAAFALAASPQVEQEADWMLWRALHPNHGADATTGVPNAMTYEIDVRSMRRLDEAQETASICFSKNAGTAAYTVHWDASVLLALP